MTQTDQTASPETSVLDHYTVDGYALSLAHRLNCSNAAEARPMNEFKEELFASLIAVFDAVAERRPRGNLFTAEDAEWEPAAFALSLARRMAGPLWGEYTEQQQARAVQHAGKYSARQLRYWSKPHVNTCVRELRDAMPYEMRMYLIELAFHRGELRTRMEMFNAYVTVAGDDVDADQLRRLNEFCRDFGPGKSPFF